MPRGKEFRTGSPKMPNAEIHISRGVIEHTARFKYFEAAWRADASTWIHVRSR